VDGPITDRAAMARALELAARGRGTVAPNPLVGAVVVRDGRVVGEGWHRVAGGPHAEVAALADAGPPAAGSTVFVTLEPCAHTGRTGPCTTALLAAGVARVVVAVADPNPVAAGGAEVLRAAGVPVEVGLLGDEAARQNRAFLFAVTRGRPLVVLKAAVSLDGRIAAADGTSRWITGPQARARAHELRADAGAVLVGAGTAVADDPRLTVRLPGWAVRQPLRVVLDGRARLPLTAAVLDGEAPTLVVVGADADPARVAALHAAGADVAPAPLAAPPATPRPAAPTAPGAPTPPAAPAVAPLDPAAVLGLLHDRGVRSVLVEGGAGVAGAFVRAGLVDELVVFVAPLLLGARGHPLLAGDGIATLADGPRFRTVAVDRAGDDTALTLVPA